MTIAGINTGNCVLFFLPFRGVATNGFTGDYALPGRRNRLSIIFLLQKKLKTKSSATSILKVSAILSVTYGIMVAGTGSILPAKLKVR